jgi:hypothetical protein
VLAVHARPPLGLFALSLTGFAAVADAVRRWRAWRGWGRNPAGVRRLATLVRPAAVGVLAAAGVLTFNGLSYLKFKTLEGAPLKYHVQYNAERLGAIDGRNFHLSNVRHNLDGYFSRPDLLIRPVFPYFYIEGYPPDHYPHAKIDLAEPTLALPYSMPAILFLAVGGGALAFLFWPDARRPLLVIAAATLPMAAALVLAIAISHRYTADFCPPLLLALAFGVTGLHVLPHLYRRIVRVVAVALAVPSVVITVAITLNFQGERVWGVPDDVRQNYQTLRKNVDGFLGFRRS